MTDQAVTEQAVTEQAVTEQAVTEQAQHQSAPQAGTRSWRQLADECAVALGSALGCDLRQEARWMLERVSGYSSTELIVHGDELVSTRSVAFLDTLLARRCAGEPLQYVLGRWQFRELELFVDRNVLIPRPETEVVAGLAIDAARAAIARLGVARHGIARHGTAQDGIARHGTAQHGTAQGALASAVVALDLGTGSGAVALSLAIEVPGLRVIASDASEAALRVAGANLAGLGRAAQRVELHHGSWFEALPAEHRRRFAVVVSNPPYIGEREAAGLPSDVRDWEPAMALFSGDDGRDALDHLIRTAPEWLDHDGVLVLEMAPDQTGWAAGLATEVGFVGARIVNDLAGKPRALVATWPGPIDSTDSTGSGAGS